MWTGELQVFRKMYFPFFLKKKKCISLKTWKKIRLTSDVLFSKCNSVLNLFGWMLTLRVSGVNALCTAGRAECDSEGPESRNNNNHKPPTVISLGNLLDIWTYFDQSEPKNFKLPKKKKKPQQSVHIKSSLLREVKSSGVSQLLRHKPDVQCLTLDRYR